MKKNTIQLALAISCICFTSQVLAATTRLIIKYKPTTPQMQMMSTSKSAVQMVRLQQMQPLSVNKLSKLSSIAGYQVSDNNAIGNGAHVITINTDLTENELQQTIEKIKQNPEIQYVEEDRILKIANITPNPTYQWDMMGVNEYSQESNWIGDNFTNAWTLLNNPGSGVYVGVIDTGYTPHPNFINNLQSLDNGKYGYQFISDCRISGECSANTSANTRLKYRPDGLDLGDYLTSQDRNSVFFNNCILTDSTWHGSHVTGTIVANSYSSQNPGYITGGAYSASVIPIRVLGKCGGYTSDIINGELWAAGFTVLNTDGSTIEPNPHPVQIINMSLGGYGACDDIEQDVINELTDSGVIVVVAAGNSGDDISYYSPAGCKNVISVASKGPENILASYSNFGATTIAASGGEFNSCFGGYCGIYSTLWSSTKGYVGGRPIFDFYQGTSMAAPHVSAAVADIISYMKANNKSYDLNIIKNILQQSAITYDKCSSYGCADGGALDVAKAIASIESGIFGLSVSSLDVDIIDTNLSKAVSVTNPTQSLITIESISINNPAGNKSSFMLKQSSTCANGVSLLPLESCDLLIYATKTIENGESATLEVFGVNGQILAKIDLSYKGNNDETAANNVPPPVNALGAATSGGCSAIASGDDFSMELLLIGLFVYIIRRKYILSYRERR